MIPPRSGRRMLVDVLGAGRRVAVVRRVTITNHHGVPRAACRIALTLPDGTPIEAVQLGRARPAFLDPRHTFVRWED